MILPRLQPARPGPLLLAPLLGTLLLLAFFLFYGRSFAVQPGTGKTFVNDVGQNTWDEVNENGSGRNLGWPGTEGDFTQSSFPNFTRPVYAYSHGSGASQGFKYHGFNPAGSILY
jgi:hypothetical protein